MVTTCLIGKMSERKCIRCENPLSMYNPGDLCRPCQEKEIEKMRDESKLHYDAQEAARILGLQSATSVKRKAQKGELPPRVPAIKKYLWFRTIFDSWVGLDHQITPVLDEENQAMLIALKLGWPVEQMTGYGYDTGYLVDQLKKFGYLTDDKPSTN